MVVDDALELVRAAGIDVEGLASEVDEKFMSTLGRALKPANGTTEAF